MQQNTGSDTSSTTGDEQDTNIATGSGIADDTSSTGSASATDATESMGGATDISDAAGTEGESTEGTETTADSDETIERVLNINPASEGPDSGAQSQDSGETSGAEQRQGEPEEA